MNGQTLLQKYYGMNAALNAYLAGQGIKCPVIKYGVDPATLKTTFKDQRASVYPYIQTHISNVRPVAWTTKEAGILTEFDFQLSFFTAPPTETENDIDFFIPFEVARVALTDVQKRVLAVTDPSTGEEMPYASLLSIQHHYEFEMRTGSPVPSAFVLARMRTVCAYPSKTGITDPTLSTDVFDGIKFTME